MNSTDQFKIIDRQTLKAKLDRHEKFHLWNVLGPKSYNPDESIPGSKHLPVDQLEEFLPKLNVGKDEEIVVYCASFQCNASKMAAEKLVKAGYNHVYAYEGGIKDWKEGKLPVGTSQGGDCSSC